MKEINKIISSTCLTSYLFPWMILAVVSTTKKSIGRFGRKKSP